MTRTLVELRRDEPGSARIQGLVLAVPLAAQGVVKHGMGLKLKWNIRKQNGKTFLVFDGFCKVTTQDLKW
jgi:hypothetical protein